MSTQKQHLYYFSKAYIALGALIPVGVVLVTLYHLGFFNTLGFIAALLLGIADAFFVAALFSHSLVNTSNKKNYKLFLLSLLFVLSYLLLSNLWLIFLIKINNIIFTQMSLKYICLRYLYLSIFSLMIVGSWMWLYMSALFILFKKKFLNQYQRYLDKKATQ